jgi:hypothetical protein
MGDFQNPHLKTYSQTKKKSENFTLSIPITVRLSIRANNNETRMSITETLGLFISSSKSTRLRLHGEKWSLGQVDGTFPSKRG